MFKATTLYTNTSLAFLLMTFLMFTVAAHAGNVIIETPLGNIELEMLEDDAPITVANFLKYINEGNYENAFMHRLEKDFVVQGGGWVFNEGASPTPVKTNQPIQNEFKVANTRGTVAMAKLANAPNSATSQWFINIADNSDNLDNQNGGFTVFARVVSGMDVVDAINELQIIYDGNSRPKLPVINYTSGAFTNQNLVMTTLTELEDEPKPFVMNAGLNDAWYDPATDGQGFFITVLPTLGSVVIAWFTYDTELPEEDAPANLGDPGHRWMTVLGSINGNTSEMTIDITSGGLFDEATTITHTTDGTVKLTFENCNSGTLVYDILSINRQGSIPIQRVANDNIELCAALYAEQ